MKSVFFSLLLIISFSLDLQAKPKKEIKRTPAETMGYFFDCANIKIEKVNFELCSHGTPRMHGTEEKYDKLAKDNELLQNGKYKKFKHCFVTVSKDGKSQTFYEIMDTGSYGKKIEELDEYRRKNCAPPQASHNQYGVIRPYCNSPEDRLDIIGPHCGGDKKPEEDCSFFLERAFSLGENDPRTFRFDNRMRCQCTDKGCAHSIVMFEKKGGIKFTDQERKEKVEEVKNEFKRKVPGCDDIVINDVSGKENTTQMEVSMSSLKCAIGTDFIITGYSCPPNFKAVEAIRTKHGNKERMIAYACLPDKSFAGPESDLIKYPPKENEPK